MINVSTKKTRNKIVANKLFLLSIHDHENKAITNMLIIISNIISIRSIYYYATYKYNIYYNIVVMSYLIR